MALTDDIEIVNFKRYMYISHRNHIIYVLMDGFIYTPNCNPHFRSSKLIVGVYCGNVFQTGVGIPIEAVVWRLCSIRLDCLIHNLLVWGLMYVSPLYLQ